ncbi:hypothetical protein CCACVL1_03199 [Corchorus capsularis]|uniref:Uncharacterized protein n=1 Tax=Corchorus capsularis TaxID=210143 RepID=A0A1R3K1P2_COCAP|nr:hypothetical protein CCACVL1_03199 [Corchorus capsularis]
MMRRSYNQTPGRQNSGWDTTSHDYHAHLSKMERNPTMIPDAPQYPVVHRAFNNKYNFEEEVEFLQQGNGNQQQKSPKKVHMADQVESIDETKYEDLDADGYIQQKYKAFELCKWKTFKLQAI